MMRPCSSTTMQSALRTVDRPVGDDEAGAAVHQAVHAALHQCLGTGVDGGSCLIEDQHRRVGHGGAGDGQQLALALRQVRTVAGQHGVVAIRQTLDEAIRVGQLAAAMHSSSLASRRP